MNDQIPARAEGRRQFLKKAAATVGGGLGLVLVSAGPAQAVGVQCCFDASCGYCPGAERRYRCVNRCTSNSYCICTSDKGQCFDGQC